MNTVKSDLELIADHAGDYIQLGGMGIMDGLPGTGNG